MHSTMLYVVVDRATLSFFGLGAFVHVPGIPPMVSRTSNQRCFCERRGFTLVELLVTMAILLLLLALLLPAIQSVREAGRRAHCQNSLKQIATALFIYHDSHGTFPQGGWGHEWVGVPERGSGQRQPGGWIYRLLPHIEESALHDLGLGADGNDVSTCIPSD